MQNKYKHKIPKNKLTRWLIFEATSIVIASVCTNALLDFYINYIQRDNKTYNPIYSIGMILPMAIILWFFTFTVSKVFTKCFSVLEGGLKKLSTGDFSVRLNKRYSGFMPEAFDIFNKVAEELEGVQIFREDFVNQYSHEFKTPLTSINGFAKLLLDTDMSEEKRKQCLQIIADESERLANLANSSLFLSKLDSQQFLPDRKPYALDEQLKQCAILLSNKWIKKSIDFTAELVPVTYYGNADLMQHVWINLLNNAIKFTPENGEITITMTKENGMIHVHVSDTGIGMNDETKSHIFEKYYQCESNGIKGMGLGLPIVKRIVELCSGTIEVKSSENEGSTFMISLPENHDY